MPKPKRRPTAKSKSTKRKAAVAPALIAEAVEALSMGDPEAARSWMEKNWPQDLEEGLALCKALLSRCRKGSRLEHFRGCFEGLRDTFQRRLDLFENSRARTQKDPVGALAALCELIEGEGLLPDDWETREGSSVCVTRWHHEVCERMGVALDFQAAGETARYREALRSTREAARICMDRVLTLPREEREELAAGIAQELALVERRCAEEFGE